MQEQSARVAFMIISDDPERALPGLVMATRMKVNRDADVRVLFFGPGVRLAASGTIDESLAELRDAGIAATACSTNVESYGVTAQIAQRPIDLSSAGAEVEQFALRGYSILTF